MIKLITICCGDRNWRDRRIVADVLATFPINQETIIITGGAAGADTIAWEIARQLGHMNIRMDAPWDAYGKRAGPVRNQWMLDILIMLRNGVADRAFADGLARAVASGPEARATYAMPAVHVHAFHDHIASSKGTADMLSRVRHASVPYTIHTTEPDTSDIPETDFSNAKPATTWNAADRKRFDGMGPR